MCKFESKKRPELKLQFLCFRKSSKQKGDQNLNYNLFVSEKVPDKKQPELKLQFQFVKVSIQKKRNDRNLFDTNNISLIKTCLTIH